MKKPVAIALVIIIFGVSAWFFLRGSAPAEQDWQLDVSSAQAPASESIPEDIRALIDGIADTDAMQASKAWLDLGARYQNAGAYLAHVKPALWDERPVHFEMVKERFSGDEHTFVYFTPRTPSTTGEPAFVHTVGQALCYHLWQYEDVSNSGFVGSFRAWWQTYAPAHGLPRPR